MSQRKKYIAALVILSAVALAGWLAFAVTMAQEEAENDADTYDYVVVGGGAAGCRMAERLSKNSANRVLLIEAGFDGDLDPNIQTVGAVTSILESQYDNQYFWQYGQVKSEVLSSPNERHMKGGRMLGGSSSINGLQYVTGTDWMRDLWVNLTGLDIWNVTNALGHYKALETYYNVDGTPGRFGTHGRLAVLEEFITAPQTTPTTMAQKLVTAYGQLTGLSALTDYNDLLTTSQLGPFLSWQLTAYPNATRSSSSVAFLSADVRARPNLHITLHSMVMRVRFNAAKRATGVTYIRNGRERHANARKRVVLCAGIYSPTILQHSGIGNGSHLASLGIPVVYDNPNVGRVIFNHQGVMAVFLKNLSDTPSANVADLYEGGAWLPSPLNSTTDAPGQSPRRLQAIGINAGEVMVIALFDLQPSGSGYIQIRDADPLRVAANSDNVFVPPGGTVDRALMVAAIKAYICGLSNEFQGTGVGPLVDSSYLLIDPPLALCTNDTLIDQWVLDNDNLQAHHWVASCRMGKAGDGISVTNGRGSVWGVTGLTVADASIVPHSHDGNTQAAAYLVASTIAKEILAGRS